MEHNWGFWKLEQEIYPSYSCSRCNLKSFIAHGRRIYYANIINKGIDNILIANHTYEISCAEWLIKTIIE